ncbi:Ig-like domain repeat protein [Bdellovibrio sp. HCB209]|uniref:Ig-like domain repeat protein n=1 Tax=Bdellovibrio sp. HCB209 TaxID=3394354 RepID=UPI0039B6B30F
MGTQERTWNDSKISLKSVRTTVVAALTALVLSSCTLTALIDEVNHISTSSITGKLSNYTGNSNQSQSVSASSCVTPVVYLYRLSETGDRELPEIASTGVDDSGSYTFNLQELDKYKTEALKLNSMVIEVKGCTDQVYFRPVTGYTDQHITMSSSLLGYVLNTVHKEKMTRALQADPLGMASLMLILGTPDSMEKSYNVLLANTEATDLFTALFGVPPTVLLDASPEVLMTRLPGAAQERIATVMEAEATHWSSTYNTVYQWKLNSSVIGNLKSLSYSPGGNAQGNHTLTLTIGQNDGAGQVDLTKPYKSFSSAISISNNVPPQSPSFQVTTPSVADGNPVNTRSLILSINTGAAFANCDTFSGMLLSESNVMPSASTTFPIVCTSAGTQAANFMLSSGDATKTIYLWAKDASGTISQVPTSVVVVLDTAIPTVTISTIPLAQSKSSSQVFAFTGNDGSGVIDHFECKMDAGSWTACSSPASYASLTEGDHTFSVRAIDTAGNMSAVDSKTWHIDLTVPTLTIAGPAAITNSLTAVLTLSGADTGGSGVASYQCSLDGAAFAACPTTNTHVLAAGAHSFRARVYDGAGNVSAIQTHTWTIDTSAPTVTITSKPAATTNATSANLVFVGSDTGGGSVASYECDINGGGFAACTSPRAYSSLTDGSYTFRVRATDTAGNVGTATSYTWVVNTVTPMASITSSPNSITNQTSATFAFFATAPPSGSITGYECKLDGSAWTACTSPHTYNSLVQNSHTFEVRSIDNNSMPSDPTSFTWIIDTTNPTLTITDKPELTEGSANAQFKFTGADTGGGAVDKYYCQIDGGGFVECASPRNLTALSEGSHTFDVRVTDTAGNTSTAQTYTWSVDLTAPVLTLLTKPDSLTNQTTAAFTFSATDSGSISGYECKIDGGTATACVSGVSYSSLIGGAHSFEVVAIDAAGNSSNSVTYSWTIDLIAPTVTIAAKPNANSNSATAVFGFTGSDTGGGSIAGYQCKLDGGAYSSCVSGVSFGSLADGSHTVSIMATDTAGNDGTAVSYTWTVDTVAPTLTITTPSANGYVIPYSSLTSVSIGGACSENGVNVTLSGVSASPAVCASNAWSMTVNMAAVADATYTLTANQTDAAGNVGSSAGRTVVKDATAPAITVTTPAAVQGGGVVNATWVNTEVNVATGSSFTVELYDGANWSTIGTRAATAGNNSAVNYSYNGISVPVTNTNAARLRVTLVDAAGNQTAATSGAFVIDNTPPTLSSFVLNSGGASTNKNNIPVSFTGVDSLSNISKICMKTSSTAPTSGSSCWVNVASYGLAASKNLSTSSIYYNVGLVSGTYTIYIWLMDAVGNISTNAASTGVDRGTIVYNSPNPPSISAIQLTSTDTPGNPPAGNDLKVTSGQPIYLKWNIVSTTGLAANSIRVSYTVDDSGETGVLSSTLSNGANGGCTVTAGYTGCAMFSAPVGTYFRLKLKAVDTEGFLTTITSNPLNSGSINFLAGNTDLGLGSSAKSALLQPSGSNSLAVLDDGRIFVVDSRGLAWVNPTTGVYEIIATTASSASGDGGPLTSAKFKSITGIWVDSNNDILVADERTIRKINTRVSPMTIARYIGGGSDTGSYVGIATNYRSSINIKRLSVSSNGDIYFVGENSRKVRKYTAATGAVSLITLSGAGNTNSTTQDNTLCTHTDYFVKFDTNGNTEKMGWVLSSGGTGSSCAISSTNETRTYAQVDPTTGIAMLPAPGRINNATGFREPVDFYNDKSGNLYTGYYNSTNAQGIFKFDASTLTWSRIYGLPSIGTCADATPTDECALQVQAMAFNSQGQLFYIDARSKAIRTIDYEEKIRTLAGDPLGSENGKAAGVSRFVDLTDVKAWNNNGTSTITLYDFGDVRMREFVPGGNLTTVAGLQYTKNPTNGQVASAVPMANVYDGAPTRFLLAANGDIYYPRQQGWASRILRSTGVWDDILGGWTYGPGPVALNGNTLLVSSFSYNGTLNRLVDSRLQFVNISGKTQTRAVWLDGSTNIDSTVCADNAVVAGSCSINGLALDRAYQGAWDPATSSYLVADTGGNRIAKFASDGSGVMSTLLTTGSRTFSFFTTNRPANLSSNAVFTCTGGVLYKYDLNNSGAESTIALPNTTFTCKGPVTYDSNRGTLLFVYKQNGLEGVAEVINP